VEIRPGRPVGRKGSCFTTAILGGVRVASAPEAIRRFYLDERA